jgi:ferredoxin--NADP+ reductase/benzoate/toluate 1,2-dioxygenase reductase subunit
MPDAPRRYSSRVMALRNLSEDGYELSLERKGLPFLAGQLITVHGREITEDRSYTVCSGEQEENLDVLFRSIPEGVLTPQLLQLQAGDAIEFSGAYGHFVLRDTARPMVAICTGTGIAPVRSYVRTHRGLPLTILHGVRYGRDLYYREELEVYDYHPCVSREPGHGFHGRVEDCLGHLAFPHDCHFYLCGSNEMILDVHELLRARGVDETHIFSEAYYYHSEI